MRLARSVLLTLFLCASFKAAAAPDAATYFRDPILHDAAMSPDGRQVGMLLTNDAGRAMVGVLDVETQAMTPTFSYNNADVIRASWASNVRLLLDIANVSGSAQAVPRGMVAVNRDGANFTQVAELRPDTTTFADPGRHAFVGTTDTDGLLRAGLAPNYIWMTGVYEKGGATVLLRRNTGSDTIDYVFGPYDRMDEDRSARRNYTLRRLVDEKAALRVALIQRDGQRRLFHYTDAGDWRQLVEFEPGSAATIEPLLYLKGKLYVQARNGQDTVGVYRYDIAARKLGDEPLISTPGNDADGKFIVGQDRILGYRSTAGAMVTIWYDARLQETQRRVDAALPNTVNVLMPAARTETPYVLLGAHSAREPQSFFLFHTGTGKLTRIGESMPGLDPKAAPLRVTANVKTGGYDMPTWLSVPAGQAGKRLPLVVLLGPASWQRVNPDAWNPVEHFLVAQGYAVLQLDPRGTYGYGAKYFHAGWREWGGALQEDLAAAVRSAVATGMVDPNRVCIAGTGFGGYAAVLATSIQPDLFKCALSWSPDADPAMMEQREQQSACNDAMHTPAAMIGGRSQPALLDAARRYPQPVLLAYGMEERGLANYAPQLGQRLKAGNTRSEVLTFNDKGRQTPLAANRIAFWDRAAEFLDKQIGAN